MATYEVYPVPRKVEAGRATAWLGEGWRLFTAAPAVWLAITVVLLVIYVLLGRVPGLGQIASTLLTPALVAGLMQCSRTAAAGAPLQFECMFSGFRRNTANLVMVGLLTLAGFTLISIVAFAVLGVAGGVSVLRAIQNGAFSSVEAGAVIGALLLTVLVWMLLALPLTMAIWFAPALVYFDDMPSFDAMKSSYSACLRNWLPLGVYGLLLMVLAFIATLPFGLGWLVLMPVMAASIYISYCDLYGRTSE